MVINSVDLICCNTSCREKQGIFIQCSASFLQCSASFYENFRSFRSSFFWRRLNMSYEIKPAFTLQLQDCQVLISLFLVKVLANWECRLPPNTPFLEHYRIRRPQTKSIINRNNTTEIIVYAEGFYRAVCQSIMSFDTSNSTKFSSTT